MKLTTFLYCIVFLLLGAFAQAQDPLVTKRIESFIERLDAAESQPDAVSTLSTFYQVNAVIYSDWLDPDKLKLVKKCLTIDELLTDIKNQLNDVKKRSVKRSLKQISIASNGKTAVLETEATEEAINKDGQKYSRTWAEIIYLVTANEKPAIVCVEIRAAPFPK